MKTILLSIYLLIAGAVSAQITCPTAPCLPSAYTHIDLYTPHNFVGDQCLVGTGLVDSVFSSFTDYTKLSFRDTVTIQVTLDFTTGSKKLYLQNYVYIQKVLLDGNDAIADVTDVNGGICVIRNVVFTSPGTTALYVRPGRAIWIDGSYYFPGSSYTNNTNPNSKIAILACGNGSLALPAVVKPVFHPNITYQFIVTQFDGGRELRIRDTYAGMIRRLPYSNYPYIVSSGGMQELVRKVQ